MNEFMLEERLLDRVITNKIIVEITLNGKVAFQEILGVLQCQFDRRYKIVTMNIEYLGKYNFGNLIVELEVKELEYDAIERLLSNMKVSTKLI